MSGHCVYGRHVSNALQQRRFHLWQKHDFAFHGFGFRKSNRMKHPPRHGALWPIHLSLPCIEVCSVARSFVSYRRCEASDDISISEMAINLSHWKQLIYWFFTGVYGPCVLLVLTLYSTFLLGCLWLNAVSVSPQLNSYLPPCVYRIRRVVTAWGLQDWLFGLPIVHC